MTFRHPIDCDNSAWNSKTSFWLLAMTWWMAVCLLSCKPPAKQVAAKNPQDTTESRLGGVTDDGADGFDSLEDDEDDDGPGGIEEILEDCGVSAKDLDDPDKVILKKTIKSWPKVLIGQQAAPLVGNVNYKIKIRTVLNIESTMKKTVTDTDFEIEATPSQAESKAEEGVLPYKGKTTAELLDVEERTALGEEHDDWSGVLCTVMPTKKITSRIGGKSRVVEFEPAVPASVSPRAILERYEDEIGSSRTFDGIVAKVIRSSDSELRKGKEIDGSIEIQQVDPTLILAIGDSGETATITADVAFKVTADFGSAEKTRALGLYRTQIFYIDTDKKDFAAIVVDTGLEETGTVVLSDKFD